MVPFLLPAELALGCVSVLSGPDHHHQHTVKKTAAQTHHTAQPANGGTEKTLQGLRKEQFSLRKTIAV